MSGATVKAAAENVISLHGTYAPPVSQVQTRETDIRALAELTRALDKKVIYLFVNFIYLWRL